MLKYHIKLQLEKHPRLFMGVLRVKRFRHWSKVWLVSRHSDITIEGYPRSGNSFARAAFSSVAGEECRIATHVHSYAQILRSVQLGIPTLVLVRPPKDACLSFVALTYQIHEDKMTQAKLRQAKSDLMNNLRSYIRFYQETLKVVDGIVLADFFLVTKDYARVLQRLNRRFDRSFPLYHNSPENDAALFKGAGFHLSPDKRRDSIKNYLRQCYDSEELIPLLEAANTMYQKVIAAERKQASEWDG